MMMRMLRLFGMGWRMAAGAVLSCAAVAAMTMQGAVAQQPSQKTEVLSGHLMPFKCQNDDKPTHTRDCAMRPECAVTGYGLGLPDGTFVQFDADSNRKAAALLAESTKATDLVAEAEGERVGPLFRARTIRLK